MRLKNFSLSTGTKIFKALSDDSRLRILFLLLENKQMCITDLELILDFTQTKTSRHLTYLKNSGIVNAKKIDQWVFYYIKDEVYDITNQMLSFLKKDLDLKKDQETYKVLYSNRELALYKIEHTNSRGKDFK